MTPGALAWVMSAQGVIHRAQFLGVVGAGEAWELSCDSRRPFRDPRLHVLERRPRDANVCVRCARALKMTKARASSRQGQLFDLDGGHDEAKR